MAISSRPDLDRRKGTSKSAIIDFDICQQRTFFGKYHPMPYIPTPRMTFGSCVDRGVEVLIECARAGIPLDYRRAFVAAREAQERDGVLIPQQEVRRAVRAFGDDRKQPKPPLTGCPQCGAEVRERLKPRGQDRPPGWRCSGVAEVPAEPCSWTTDLDDDPACHGPRQLAPINQHDWAYCRTQANIHVQLRDLGEVDGHPDIILASNEVDDVKTSQSMRKTARTIELILYALIVEEEAGRPVPEVGYLVFVRTSGVWREVRTFVTDEMREWAYQRTAAFVRAQRADDMLNKGREVGTSHPPINWTWPGGPTNAMFCDGCRFHPLFGGPCEMAITPEGNDDE